MIGRWFKPYPSSLRLWSFFTIFCLDSVWRNEPTASSFFPTRDKTWSIRIQYVLSGRWQEGEEEEEEEEEEEKKEEEEGSGKMTMLCSARFICFLKHSVIPQLNYPLVKYSILTHLRHTWFSIEDLWRPFEGPSEPENGQNVALIVTYSFIHLSFKQRSVFP